jgi:hypothetical protein
VGVARGELLVSEDGSVYDYIIGRKVELRLSAAAARA